MAGIARGRLQEERKLWRKDHPHVRSSLPALVKSRRGPQPNLRRVCPPRAQGFVAKPKTLEDGTQDILNWECVVPGKAGTIWEAGRYPVYMCVRLAAHAERVRLNLFTTRAPAGCFPTSTPASRPSASLARRPATGRSSTRTSTRAARSASPCSTRIKARAALAHALSHLAHRPHLTSTRVPCTPQAGSRR